MVMQFIIAVGLAIVSVFYILFRFTKQLSESDKNAHCNDCPAINIDRDRSKL